jgi:hypothetical protein
MESTTNAAFLSRCLEREKADASPAYSVRGPETATAFLVLFPLENNKYDCTA